MSTATLDSKAISFESTSFPLLPTIALFANLLFALFCFLSAGTDPTGMYWLTLLGAIQLFPMLLASVKKRLDYLAVSSFATFATYTLGKYNNAFYVRGLSAISNDSLTEIKEMIFCTLILMGAFYAVRFLGKFDRDSSGEYKMFEARPGVFFLITTLVLLQPVIETYIPWNFRNIYVTIHGFLFFMLFCLKSTKFRYINVAAPSTVFLSGIFFYLNTGMMTFILLAIILCFITFSLQRKLKYTLLLVFIIYPLAQIQMVKAQYRSFIWGPEGPSYTLIDRIGLMTALLTGSIETDPGLPSYQEVDSDEEGEGKLAAALDRASDERLERVIALTPSSVPFWNGETYESLLYVFIPRFVWPGKPSIANFNKFGKLYGYLGEDDDGTSVGATAYAEGYMNFGYPGLYGVSIFLGILLAVAQQLGPWLFGTQSVLGFVLFFMPLASLTSLGVLIPPLINLVIVVFPFRKWIRRALSFDA